MQSVEVYLKSRMLRFTSRTKGDPDFCTAISSYPSSAKTEHAHSLLVLGMGETYSAHL